MCSSVYSLLLHRHCVNFSFFLLYVLLFILLAVHEEKGFIFSWQPNFMAIRPVFVKIFYSELTDMTAIFPFALKTKKSLV